MTMETVKTVKDYEITRYAGTKGPYFLNIAEDDGPDWNEFHPFKTVEVAKEFIERVLCDKEEMRDDI